MKDEQTRLDLVDRLLARNLAWVAAADAKVPAVFAIDAAMLGTLVALLPSSGRWQVWTAIVSAFAGSGLLASVVCLALVSFPRLKGPKGSLVYFGGAITMSENDYLEAVCDGPTAEIVTDLARQAYRNAEIAAAKYSHVRTGMLLLFGSMLPWLVSVALLYGNRP
jgi:hypothetical protein